MNRASRDRLSEAQLLVVREAAQIKRTLKRTESKIRKAEKKARDKAQNLEVVRSALAGVQAKFRQPRERDNEHLQFVRRLPCVACVALGEVQTTPTRAAHIRCAYPEPGWPYTGKAEKPSDHRTAPLCDFHHTDGPDAQHKSNERDWWARLGFYPPSMCTALVAARKSGADPVEIIHQTAAEISRNRRGA